MIFPESCIAGELGWEVYTDMENMVPLYNTVLQEGKHLDIGHFGTRVVNTLRIEKGIKHTVFYSLFFYLYNEALSSCGCTWTKLVDFFRKPIEIRYPGSNKR